MDSLYMLIAGACLILIVAVVLLLHRYRSMEKDKNRIIAGRLREQDRIARELEHTRIEKETYEKLLKNKLEAMDN